MNKNLYAKAASQIGSRLHLIAMRNEMFVYPAKKIGHRLLIQKVIIGIK